MPVTGTRQQENRSGYSYYFSSFWCFQCKAQKNLVPEKSIANEFGKVTCSGSERVEPALFTLKIKIFSER